MIRKKKWEQLFGIPMRESSDKVEQSHKNLALAIQIVTEEILHGIVQSIKADSNSNNLCICGGVALNCAANGTMLSNGIYRNIYVPFAPGDCGCSIGATLAYSILSTGNVKYSISPYLGPEYSDKEIERILIESNLNYSFCEAEQDFFNRTARLIADGAIIGWFQGRMELGPRALGNRSILADARNPKMKDMVNSRIKFREAFRPFAPSVMEEYADSYFLGCSKSPFMMFTYPVTTKKLPAITHIDGTARVQTVCESDNSKYYKLLRTFKALTRCPAILNTSFNVMGEPIVCTPSDAIATFKKSGLDYLAIGKFIVKK